MDQKIDYCFRIYGDNILECELFVDWLVNPISKFKLITEIGPIDRPILLFNDTTSDKIFAFQMCPFYGGIRTTIWPNSQLKGIFSEKPDVLIVKVNDDATETEPIFVIEFDDALQAGNQSWQRARRSVDAANSNIPYFYVIPIIGWERNSDGLSLKNPRYLNASITIGQLSLSTNFCVPSLQIFKNSSWTEYAEKLSKTLPNNFQNFSGVSSAIELISFYLRKSSYDSKDVSKPYSFLENIIAEMLEVAKTYSDFSNTKLPIHVNHPALDECNRRIVSSQLSKKLLDSSKISSTYRLDDLSKSDFYRNGALFHKDVQAKTTSQSFRNNIMEKINWTRSETAQRKRNWLQNWGIIISPTENPDEIALKNLDKIPVTYKENKSEAALISNRAYLRKIIKTAYPSLPKNILDWIYSTGNNEPIFFIPLYGYKPTGDSRPDRGLLPALFSQFPKLLRKENTMLIMYSKYTPTNWINTIQNDSNQLWTAIKEFCGLIIVDKTKTGMII